MSNTTFIDVHVHLYSEKYDRVEEVLGRAKEFNLEKIICSGSDLENSRKSIEIAEKFDEVYVSVGVHPDDVENLGNKELEELKKLASHKKVVAIGEIGLDYYTSEVSKERQKEAFLNQMKLANELKLPFIVHCREATGDMIDILKENQNLLVNGAVIHCFNKNSTVAKTFLDLGCHLSIGGCSTFPNTDKLKESIRIAPLDRILLETDCPYMTPVPLRGQVNEPKNVVIVAEEIARIKGISVEEVAKATTANAKRLFKF